MADKYLNFINGKYVPAKSGKTYENRNPEDTDDLIGLFPSSDAADVADAVAAAKVAYPKWKATPAPARGEINLGRDIAGACGQLIVQEQKV